jgi:adenylate kinase
MDTKTLILIGPSGSGKGTQVTLLREYLEQHDPGHKVLYVQVGKRFRDLAEGQTFTSKLVRSYIEEGALAPGFLTIWAWGTVLVDTLNENQHVIFDGTPRKLQEAQLLDEALRFYKRDKAIVVSLLVSNGCSRERLEKRGRTDDVDPRDIDRRLGWYETEVIPVINFFKERPDFYSVIEVDGEQDIQGVHQAILKAVT